MLKINQLYKSFNSVEVLKGIDAEFNPGETSMIIGQSGSGKTVLLKCLLDLYSYDTVSYTHLPSPRDRG